MPTPNLFELPGLKNGETNPGGLVSINAAREEDIDSIPAHDPLTGKITADVVVLSGHQFHPIYFTKGSGKLLDSPEGEHDHRSYMYSVQFTVPKDRPEVILWVEQNINAKFVIQTEDANALIRLVGSKKIPAILQAANQDTGGTGTDKNARTFEFKLIQNAPHPARVYEGAIPLTPVP